MKGVSNGNHSMHAIHVYSLSFFSWRLCHLASSGVILISPKHGFSITGMAKIADLGKYFGYAGNLTITGTVVLTFLPSGVGGQVTMVGSLKFSRVSSTSTSHQS